MEKKGLLAVILGVLALVIVLVVVIVGLFFSTNNTCVAYEMGIQAQFEQNKNNYDNYFKKLAEAAQVPEMYRDDLRKVYDGVMAGRYGKDGSKAVFQFIQEQNINVDPVLHRQLQQIVEAGRNSFESNQKDLISRKQEYKKYILSMPYGLLAKLFGFPKIDLDKYKIVTSEETEKDFETGKSKPIKLRQ